MTDASKKILVTGATGFTGGALVRKLASDGHHVRALVRDPNASSAQALTKHRIELIPGDIRRAADVQAAAEGVDLIQHIAAVFRTAGHPDSYYHDVNVAGVEHVLQAARHHGVPRTVHCSTVGVHGHVSQIPSDESAPYNPGDIYQDTKLEGERVVQRAIAEGFPGVIFRPAGMYGPGDLRFLKVFKGVQRGRFPMFGSGEVTYQFTYIDDLVDGIALCGFHENALGELVILCGDGWVSLNHFVKLVAAAVGGKPPKIHWPLPPLLAAAKVCETVCKPLKIDPPLHVRRCEFYIKARAFNNAKAKRLLGFQPKFSMAAGVYETAKWYAEQGLVGPIVNRSEYDAAVADLPDETTMAA
ncbi:MAG: NAD-dependent epimerase/dehydratase family protein [Planctomycetota bacterium]